MRLKGAIKVMLVGSGATALFVYYGPMGIVALGLLLLVAEK